MALNITQTVTYLGTVSQYDKWANTGITFEPKNQYLVSSDKAALLVASGFFSYSITDNTSAIAIPFSTASAFPGAAAFGIGYVTIDGVLYYSDGANLFKPGNATRTTPLRIATFGDSTATVGSAQSPASQDTTRASSSVWNSGTVNLTSYQDRFSVDMFYPQAYLVGTGGIISQTTTQMVARDTLVSSSTRFATSDMINLAPNVVIMRAGVNDLTGVSAGTVDAAVATALANIKTLIARFNSAGIFVLVEGITSSTGSNLAVTKAGILALNAQVQAYVATLPNARFLSPVGVVSDSTGGYLPNMSADNLHLTAWGQYQLARAEAAILSNVFGQSINHRYPGTNVFTNFTFANQTSGTATGITFNTTNATAANKKIEVINGLNFQTGEFTLTGASPQCGYLIAYDPTTMGITAGDIYGFECDIYLAGLNGYVPSSAASFFRVDTRDTVGVGRVQIDKALFNSTSSFPDVYTGHITFPPLVYGDSSAGLTTASNWNMTFFPAETSGTLKFGIANPRIVKLNQPVTTI